MADHVDRTGPHVLRHLLPFHHPLVVSDTAGDVFTSTNPTGGPGAWSAPVSVGAVIESLACPTVSLCVGAGGLAGSNDSAVVTSTDPTGGSGAWTPVDLGSTGPLGSIACPSTSLCIATRTYQGAMFTSTDPTGGSAAWTSGVPSEFGSTVSCASDTLCVMLVGGYSVLTSTDPAGGASTWSKPVSVDPTGLFDYNGLDDPHGEETVSCSSSGFCAVGDSVGYIATSTNPAAGTSAWQLTPHWTAMTL